MIETCSELRLLSSKCDSDFHRALTHWTTHAKQSARFKEAGRRCKALGKIYDDSLNKLLKCLGTHEPSTALQEEIDRLLEFKRILAANLALIP